MAFERLIYVYESDGTTADTTYYASGKITDALPGCEFVLGARGGCRGGKLILPGTIRQPFKFDRGQIVKFFYDSTAFSGGEPIYAGIIRSRVATIDDHRHVYELAGYWDEIKKADMSARVRLGSAGDAGYTGLDTPEEIIKWLIDGAGGPGGDNTGRIEPATGIDYDGADIVASGQTITDFLLDDNDDIYRVIEQLELIASAGGDHYVAGVTAKKKFYFLPISTDEDDVQTTFTVGLDATRGEEERLRREPSNRITVLGGFVTTKGKFLKLPYSDSTSISAYGASRRASLYAPALSKEADVVKFKSGYFNRFAGQDDILRGVMRVHGAAEEPPRPWLGQAVYSDTARGDIMQKSIGQMTVHWDWDFYYETELGDEHDAASGSYYAPSISREVIEREIPNIDTPFDMLPEGSDVTDYPDDGPGYTGGTDGAGVGLAPGTIMEVSAPPVAIMGDEISVDIQINLGGETSESAGEVHWLYDIMDTDLTTPISTGLSATAIKQYTDGNIEVWRAAVTLPESPGWMRGRARAHKIGTDPAEYFWFPDDTEKAVVTSIVEAAGGSGGTYNIIVATGFQSGVN